NRPMSVKFFQSGTSAGRRSDSHGSVWRYLWRLYFSHHSSLMVRLSVYLSCLPSDSCPQPASIITRIRHENALMPGQTHRELSLPQHLLLRG
ncbi:hypothetical protein KUCAC02_028896, partial [Chaenocephalus aceratus]